MNLAGAERYLEQDDSAMIDRRKFLSDVTRRWVAMHGIAFGCLQVVPL